MNLIERLKELDATATPGPWKASNVADRIEIRTGKFNSPYIARCYEGTKERADADLIIETRNTLPKLLAFVDAFDRMAGWQDIATEITKEVWDARYALEGEG